MCKDPLDFYFTFCCTVYFENSIIYVRVWGRKSANVTEFEHNVAPAHHPTQMHSVYPLVMHKRLIYLPCKAICITIRQLEQMTWSNKLSKVRQCREWQGSGLSGGSHAWLSPWSASPVRGQVSQAFLNPYHTLFLAKSQQNQQSVLSWTRLLCLNLIELTRLL